MTKRLLSSRLLVECALFSSRNLSEQLLEMEDKCNIHCVHCHKDFKKCFFIPIAKPNKLGFIDERMQYKMVWIDHSCVLCKCVQ